MSNQTITQEGSFSADIRNAINSNFSSLASGGTSLSGLTLTFSAKSGSSDALPITGGFFTVTATGVDAMTLAAPTADGIVLFVTSETAQAHTITATSLLATGGASSPYTTATFAAKKGAGVLLVSANLLWNLISSAGVTFT
jgi:hypothetical protein